MHDGTPVHVAYIIRNLLREIEVRVMNWPAGLFS